MNTSAIIVAVFPALLIVGALLAPLLARRDRPARSPRGPGYRGHDLGHFGISDQGVPSGMTESRLADEGATNDPPAEGDQYFTDWAALQARFNEEPA